MTPGPTPVPEQARLAMARQVIHHRTAEFRGVLAEVLADLKYVFATENDVLVLSCSGTGAMEAAVVNLVPRGGKAIVLESGVFSRRWADICIRFGIEVVRHAVPWGQAVEARDVARLLANHPDAVAVFGTLMESSTGVGHDVRAIGQVVAESEALLGRRRNQRRRRHAMPGRQVAHRRAGRRLAKSVDDASGLGLSGGQRSGLATNVTLRAAGFLL